MLSGVIGAVDVCRVDFGEARVKPAGLAGRDRDVSLHQVLGQAPGEFIPRVAPIRGLEYPTPRSAIRIPVFPGPLAPAPQARVKHIGIRGVYLNVRAARVLILIEDLLPRLAAVCRAKNASLLVGAIGMAEYRRK